MANKTIPDLTAATLPISRSALVELSVAGVSRRAALNTIGEWDVEIVKSSDQGVTNNSTPQNDSELLTTLESSSFYLVELHLMYTGDTSGDYKCHFTFPFANAGPRGFSNGFDLAGTGVITAFAAVSNTQTPDVALHSSAAVRTAMIQFSVLVDATGGTLQYKFANNAAGIGRTSTTKAGSTLRVRKLA